MRRTVHQFVPGLLCHDGVGDEVQAWRAVLRAAGYESEIFAAEVTAADRANGVRLLDEYAGDEHHLLIYHHSIGNDFVGRISALPDRLVLRYHNLTPARFFPGNRAMQHSIELGGRQVRFLRDRVAGALCASTFNAQALLAHGYAQPTIVPSVFSLDRLRGRDVPRDETHELEPLILCVGRGAANKRQDHVLYAFERFAQRFAPTAQLALVGDLYADFDWGATLTEAIRRSPLRDRILTPGSVSDDALVGYYRRARLYLSMSEHEGFCIPPLESFGSGVPVLAYRIPAVAETMGGAGVLFARKRWEEVTALMAELCFDADLRHRIIAAQRERLERPDLTEAPQRLLAAVEGLLPAAGAPRRPLRVATVRHVAIVSPFDGSSEVAVSTRALMRAFESSDLQVSVLTDAYGLRAGADPAGVERIHSGRADAFVSAAIERGADVVHLALEPAHSIHPPVLQRLIDGLCAAGIPTYATIHGPFVPGAAALAPLAETARWLARCEAVFTHSRGDTECLRDIGISDCQTLPLGVPAMPYYDHAALAHDLGLAGRRVVAFLGHPVQASGLRETIEAMLLLESRYPELLLLAIAPQWEESDWYLHSCRAQLARADLLRSVFVFDRPMGDAVTAMLLGAAEIVLVPAVDAGGHAPFSVRLPLAAGRATVASRWLIPDGVEDAVCALPALTPQHIARAIEDLLAQGVRRADHEAAARRIAREQSWECVASAYRSVFDRRRQRAMTKVVAVEARGRHFETRKRLHGGTDDDAVSPAELAAARPGGAKLRPV